MNRIPIVFAFDNKIAEPACVCMTSLMDHAKESTFYELIVVHSGVDHYFMLRMCALLRVFAFLR